MECIDNEVKKQDQYTHPTNKNRTFKRNITDLTLNKVVKSSNTNHKPNPLNFSISDCTLSYSYHPNTSPTINGTTKKFKFFTSSKLKQKPKKDNSSHVPQEQINLEIKTINFLKDLDIENLKLEPEFAKKLNSISTPMKRPDYIKNHNPRSLEYFKILMLEALERLSQDPGAVSKLRVINEYRDYLDVYQITNHDSSTPTYSN